MFFCVREKYIDMEGHTATPRACETERRHMHKQGRDDRDDVKKYYGKKPPTTRGMESEKDK